MRQSRSEAPAGAHGYRLQEEGDEELITAVRAVTGKQAPRRPPETLSTRELELFQRVAKGPSCNEIGPQRSRGGGWTTISVA